MYWRTHNEKTGELKVHVRHSFYFTYQIIRFCAVLFFIEIIKINYCVHKTILKLNLKNIRKIMKRNIVKHKLSKSKRKIILNIITYKKLLVEKKSWLLLHFFRAGQKQCEPCYKFDSQYCRDWENKAFIFYLLFLIFKRLFFYVRNFSHQMKLWQNFRFQRQYWQ